MSTAREAPPLLGGGGDEEPPDVSALTALLLASRKLVGDCVPGVVPEVWAERMALALWARGVMVIPPGAVVVDPEGEIPEAAIQACAQAYRDYRDEVYGRKPAPRLDGDHTAAIAVAGLRAALRAWPKGRA